MATSQNMWHHPELKCRLETIRSYFPLIQLPLKHFSSFLVLLVNWHPTGWWGRIVFAVSSFRGKGSVGSPGRDDRKLTAPLCSWLIALRALVQVQHFWPTPNTQLDRTSFISGPLDVVTVSVISSCPASRTDVVFSPEDIIFWPSGDYDADLSRSEKTMMKRCRFQGIIVFLVFVLLW